MNLKLIRKYITPNSTIGQLSFEDAQPFCYTLEDIERAEKVYGKTAIPCGTYELRLSYSNRFKQEMPILLEVPNFEGIRIHPGNTAENTEGCILLGFTHTADFIGRSREAYSAFMLELRKRIKSNERVWLTIEHV
jgi:hypothetical protein